MARYGSDHRGWETNRYDRGWGRPEGGQPGYGGMRSDGWGSNWRDFPGEEGWFGEASPGYEGPYDDGFRQGRSRGGFEGGREFGRSMGGPEGGRDYGRPMGADGYGMGYGGRDVGYGGFDYERGGGGRWGIGRQQRERSGGSRIRASEIMTENPECVTPETSLMEVAQKMRDLDVGIIPVVDSMDNRRLRGVVTDRDITIRAVAEGKDGKTTVRDCMTDDVETVNKNDAVGEVLRVMSQEQVRRVPVTDREGRLVGIIAQADLAVDYTNDEPEREMRVEDTIQQISEPARPRRGAMAAGSRGGQSDEEA